MYLVLIIFCTIASATIAFTISKSFAKSPPSLAINIAFVGLIVNINFFLLGFIGDVTNQSGRNILYGLILTALATIFAACAGRSVKDRK